MNALSLKDKRIVITGASSGIGRACAVFCASLGATLALFGRNESELDKTRSMLDGQGHRVFSQGHEDIETLDNAVKTFVAEAGAVDGLAHCAGVNLLLAFRMHRNHDFTRCLEVNTIYAFEVARILARKKYINAAGASFVFIASVTHSCGVRGQVAYAASKGALVSGVKSLAMELAPKHIRANTVSPGMVSDTRMTEEMLERMSEEMKRANESGYPLGLPAASDVAAGCAFLLSDLAAKITGTDLVIDGGFSAA